MDKQLKKKTWTVKRIATYGGIAVLVFFVSYQVIFADRRSKLKIEKDKITISEVKRGEFKEYIPQTGIVEPLCDLRLSSPGRGGSCPFPNRPAR